MIKCYLGVFWGFYGRIIVFILECFLERGLEIVGVGFCMVFLRFFQFYDVYDFLCVFFVDSGIINVVVFFVIEFIRFCFCQFVESWMGYFGFGYGIFSLAVFEKYIWCLDYKGGLFCSALFGVGLRWQKFEDVVQQVVVLFLGLFF